MVNDIYNIETKDFPLLLKQIDDPPEKLFVRGQIPDDTNKFLCVVGSRKCSNYGRELCNKLISGLGGQPIVIVSGLALGIDTEAHKTALKNNIKTIAVPGSGLDPQVLYPRNNFRLSEEILSSGGALISEYEPKFRATVWSFPKRNRIMAGLSHATLIIEATERSGTLITARLATEYNRDVLAVPGSIFSENSSGPNDLIRDGAVPIRSSNDILEALGIESSEKNMMIVFKESLNKNEKQVVDKLTEPKDREQLMEETNLSITDLNITIGSLEIKGVVKDFGGKIFLNTNIDRS